MKLIFLLLIGYLPLIGILLFLFLRRRRKTEADSGEELPKPKEYPTQDRAIPYAERILEDAGPSLKDADMEELKDRLCNVLEHEKLYLNPDIRVGDLAERLFTNKSYLAQTIKTTCYILIISATSKYKRFYTPNILGLFPTIKPNLLDF